MPAGLVPVAIPPPSGAAEAAAEAEEHGGAEARRPPRAAWERWAAVDYDAAQRETVRTMKEPPKWFRGNLRRAYDIALDEWDRNNSAGSWMLFQLTSRLLLTPTKTKGEAGKEELIQRFDRFLRGEWVELLAETEPAPTQQRPQRDARREDPEATRERLYEGACNRVRQGEVSRARELLTSSGLAPGNAATLAELTDPARRPATLSREIPAEVLAHVPPAAFTLDEDQLFACLSTARKGRAADLFGTRLEHLRVLLDNEAVWNRFTRMAQAFCRAEAPQAVMELMKRGRMTALKKQDGRARGIVTGCALRRLISKAVARQSASQFRDATSPYQFALQTPAGMDAMAHAIRALTDSDPDLVVISLDGIGAFDHVRRAAFLQALRDDPQLASLLPLVKSLYTTPSTYLWTDDRAEVHEVRQGEGGEQGDPLMPALYSLGQHSALQHAASRLWPGEHLFAYLDDLYVICRRERAATAFRTVAEAVAEMAGVQSHLGKLRAWCSGGGPAPADLAALGPQVWTADLPPEQNGLKVLGVPIGTKEFVQACGAERLAEERTLLDILPELPDTQCSWVLLAMSAVPRANHLLRATPPTQVQEYARAHDDALWQALNKLLGTTGEAAEENPLHRKLATLPGRMGGLGLRSADRTSTGAYWAAWCDALKVLKDKRPALAEMLLSQLDRPAEAQPACLREATEAKELLLACGQEGQPTWRQAAEGLVAPPQPEDAEAGEWRHGWQFTACAVLETYTRHNEILPMATPQQQAVIRSQSGPSAGKWLTTTPKSPQLTLLPLRMQVSLRYRLLYKLPITRLRCSCRARLDPYGYHWAACPRTGRLRLRAKPLEPTWAVVFREAGARVQTDVLLRDTNLDNLAANDRRQLEIVATGLPLYRGVPLGVDCTMLAPLHADGRPWVNADNGLGDAATTDGVAIARGERDKARTYPDLVNNNRLRLTTLACETGGKWSTTCLKVIRLLAKAKARQAPEARRARVAAAWASRWWSLLSVAARNTLAATLADEKPRTLDGFDGEEPLWHEVLLDAALEPAQLAEETDNSLEVAIVQA